MSIFIPTFVNSIEEGLLVNGKYFFINLVNRDSYEIKNSCLR